MRKLLLVLCGLAIAGAVNAGPYPALSGITAAADDATVAGNNPAAMTRFDSRNVQVELLGFFSDNTWEGQIGSGPSFTSNDTSTTIIPSSNLVLPLKNDWFFGFTILGSGSSEDYPDGWPGRYLIEEYDLVYLSAYPSLARKVNDKLSLGASLALTYTSYEQIKAVPNVDPGFGDGRLQIETDGTTVGFALSRCTSSTTEHESGSSIGRSWMRNSMVMRIFPIWGQPRNPFSMQPACSMPRST